MAEPAQTRSHEPGAPEPSHPELERLAHDVVRDPPPARGEGLGAGGLAATVSNASPHPQPLAVKGRGGERGEPDQVADTLGLTDDAFLGGQLRILQPSAGYRAGVDAVLLAASVPAGVAPGSRLLDLGAGVGTVGLAAARRIAPLRATLLEAEPGLAALACRNAERNGLADRVDVIVGDVSAPGAALLAGGLAPESFTIVVANPPFHAEGRGTPAAVPGKAAAHAMPEAALDHWIRAMARYVSAGGTATVIHKAPALAELLAAMHNRFGALRILPVHARAGEPAIRVIVRGTKGSRAPLTLLPGFVLHGADGGFTPAATEILRHGGALAM